MGQETESVKALNSLLRGEISAVETYQQAVEKIKNIQARTQLQECEVSHQQRVSKLKQRIRSLGAEPAEGSGAWGVFAKLAEGSAKLLGESSAIAVLEEGEDHGLKEYRSELEHLDPQNRQFVSAELLPEAERTHSRLSALKKTMH